MRSQSWNYYGLLLACLTITLSRQSQVSAQPIFFTAQGPEAFDAFDETEEIVTDRAVDVYWGWENINATKTKKTGFLFYPGCFYDERAYAPILRTLTDVGYPTFLLDVPLSFSILAPFRADLVMREFPDIETWVIGGHGLGGRVASLYARMRRKQYNIQGLALLSSYPFPLIGNLDNTNIEAISLWGNLDGITTQEKWEGGADSLPDDAKFVEIEGGNNSQMAWLSTTQTNDGEPTITRDSQQSVVISELLTLMNKVERGRIPTPY